MRQTACHLRLEQVMGLGLPHLLVGRMSREEGKRCYKVVSLIRLCQEPPVDGRGPSREETSVLTVK